MTAPGSDEPRVPAAGTGANLRAAWRRLADDFQEFPATMALGTLWIVVFGLMVAHQATLAGGVTARQWLIGPLDGHRFGDLTIRELYAGEVWRAVTATFVHFGLVHIGLNLYALYQLGCLVESWYGAGPFVAIYVLTGGGGNLISGAVRQSLRSNPSVPSGGGSTVIMGLVALAAVVGWRARTRIGEHLRNQMVWVLALTAAMGAGFSLAGLPVIDNWGHAGGAVVGGVVGLANRGILRFAGRFPAKLAGWLAASVLAASAAAMVSDDRAEDSSRRLAAAQAMQRYLTAERLIGNLERVRETYRAAATPRAIRRGMLFTLTVRRPEPPNPDAADRTAGPPKADAGSGRKPPGQPAPVVRIDPEQEFTGMVLTASARFLSSMAVELDAGANAADYRRAREIASQTLIDLPTLDEVREFDHRISSIQNRLRAEREAARVVAQSPAL